MAILTTLLERTFVGIDVTRRAGTEFHVFVARRPAGHIGFVAFFACHLAVQAGQRVACLRVIELIGGFPIYEIVAALAVVPQLALVGVLVASNAFLGQSKERPGRILHFDQRALRGNHIGRNMALLASQAGMFAFQAIARKAVVKLCLRRLPMNEMEIFAIVFQMAAHAFLAVRISHLNLGVITMLGLKPLGNLFMAIQALEGRRAGAELMATSAFRRAAQRLVSFRERTRGDLRASRRAKVPHPEKARQKDGGGPQ